MERKEIFIYASGFERRGIFLYNLIMFMYIFYVVKSYNHRVLLAELKFNETDL